MGWEFFDSDDFIWVPTDPPYREMRAHAERNRMLLQTVRLDKDWVLSGSVTGWIDGQIANAFDLIVFLTLPKELRLARLRARELHNLGRVDPAFIEWAGNYDDGDATIRSRVGHENWMERQKTSVLRLEGDLTNDERLARVLSVLPSVPRRP